MPQTRDVDVGSLLQKAGVDADTADAVMRIDALLQNWRRRAQKRELGQRALVELRIGLDIAQFDVLVAIDGPANEFGVAAGETMVGTVAERLAIDPSRASRLVSEMVDQGYARRAVSQADARRAVVVLTEPGKAVVEAVRAYKYLIMGDFLGTWSKGELAQFVPLLERFAGWSEHIESGSERFADEIAALARAVDAEMDTVQPGG